MAALIITLFLGLSGWILTALFRRLRRYHVTLGSWVMAGLLGVCGLAVGMWCAFYCEYHMGSDFRIGSFPIPVAFFHFEDGQWVDFPVPKVQAWFTAFTTVITIIAIATLPLWFVRRTSGCTEPGDDASLDSRASVAPGR
jgi:hypothetical protein